jgi:drug/metabolite transporter (DMT)-like permease
MTVAVAAALCAAVCSGLAAVLQAKAVGGVAADTSRGGLMRQLTSSGWYRLALLLVAMGFLFSMLALRELPIFVVAVARASSLAVTALLAWPVLGLVPRRRDVVGLCAVASGLLLVVGSAQTGPAVQVTTHVRVAMAATLAAAVLLALVLVRRDGPRAGSALAVVAGIDFALVGLGSRAMDVSGAGDLVADPAAWVVVLAGAHGLTTYAHALQRVTVTTATALMVGVETLAGALVGVLLLSDSSRPGWLPVSVAGFTLALGGAVLLASQQRTNEFVRRT